MRFPLRPNKPVKLTVSGLLAIVLLIVLMGLLFPITATASDTWGPWEVGTSAKISPPVTDKIDPLDQAVRIFQKYISPIDGARCQMYPTCSAYARQALRKHGALIGTFMAVDRLIHEVDPLEQQTPMIKWGYRRFYDPLSNNDFWLNGDERREAGTD